MLVRVKRWGNEARDLHGGELLDFLRGAANKRGELNEELEVFAQSPLRTVKAEGAAEGVAWTFSTFDLDRCEERVDPAGWELERYRANPVIQWAHAYDIPAIGRAEAVAADDEGLGGRIVFNEREYDPFGWSIGERVRRGVLRAGSVGFRVLEIEFPEKRTDGDGTTLIFRRQELLEFSVCNVPANPFALAEGKGARQGRTEGAAPFWDKLIQGGKAG